MGYVIRCSLSGYNSLTETDIDHYSVYTDSDNVLIKEKTRGSASIANLGTQTIAHGLIYTPMCYVYAEVTTGKWVRIVGDSSDYNAWFEVNNTNLIINNNLGGTKNFKYFIFHDQQI